MSLRDGALPSKQSPVTRGDIVPFGDCFAIARKDMQTVSLKTIQIYGSAQFEVDIEVSYDQIWHL